MRLTPLKTDGVSEIDGYNPISSNLAGQQSWDWDKQFWTWMHARGIGGSFTIWDQLPPEIRAKLMEIYEQGHDNVTRRKLGLTELG